MYSITKHSGFVPSLEYFKKQVFSRERGGYTVVEVGDFAYASIHLDEGSIGISPERCLISPMYTTFRLVADSVLPMYLIRYLKSPRALEEYPRFGRGSAERRRSISFDRLSQLEVPLPSLIEQRRIAEVLDRAEALRAKRRAALAQLDTLTQSIFLDLFGNPATNPKQWPRRPIGQIARVITGNTPSRAKPDYFGSAIEWIKSGNINTPHYYLTRADEGLSEAGRAVARIAPAQSILVTCIAGSPDCIGNVAMADREVAFNQQINALVPQHCDSHFLYAQVVVGKRLIQEASTAGMKGMVSKSRLESIELMVPPIGLQRDFARRVAAIERLKSVHRASLAQLDALFASLQHRAFRGEL